MNTENTPLVDCIIPTFDNVELLLSCLKSYDMSTYHTTGTFIRYIVVNNGNPALSNYIHDSPRLKLINAGKNLGWEGGLKLGLEHSKAPFVIFSNDDIRLPPGQKKWLWKMLSTFNDPSVGAVGPSSNFVMGPQNIFADFNESLLNVKYLIGFFYMVRRDALEKAGGVDDTLPGGDDIDLSIRLRDAGYKLICRHDVFVYHHGQVTGQKVHSGYWNSNQMQERTNFAIIKKHGMRKYWDTMCRGHIDVKSYSPITFGSTDVEGDICRKHIIGEKILDLGCGGTKTVANSVGVDMRLKGEEIIYVTSNSDTCVADINSDVSKDLPVPNGSQDTLIARHILEHCQDSLGTLSSWNKALKMSGKLIIAVPHNGLYNTILMNPEHITSFTPTSLNNLAICAGFKEIARYEEVNGISFVSVFEKTSVPYSEIKQATDTVLPLGSVMAMSVPD